MSEEKLRVLNDSERAVIGGIFRWPTVLAEIAPLLAAKNFRDHAHGLVYQAQLELYDKAKPIDLVSVADLLHRRNELSQLGGLADRPGEKSMEGHTFLARLWDEVPTGANAVYHAERVRDASILRELSIAAQIISEEAERAAGSAEEILQSAEKRIFAIATMGVSGNLYKMSEIIHEVYDRLDQRAKSHSEVSGISSGFDSLDAMTAGWQPGELILLAARPSVGKTALSLALARRAGEVLGVFFASLEQSRLDLAERLLCAGSGVEQRAFKHCRITPEESSLIGQAGDALSALPFWIDDSPGQNVLRIASNARRLALRAKTRKEEIPLGLVVIDYLQLIEPDNRRDPRHEQLAAISRRLKFLARELNIPILALAQLNREVESRADSRPKLSDLRGSGELEQDADVVLMLHQPDADNNPRELVVQVEKNRNGPVGDITLDYDRGRTLFAENQVRGF